MVLAPQMGASQHSDPEGWVKTLASTPANPANSPPNTRPRFPYFPSYPLENPEAT